jgi:hypothetical protein
MNNATVSDTEVSFAASLYEAFRRLRQRCFSFAIAGLSDQEVQAIGASRMDGRHADHFQTSAAQRSTAEIAGKPNTNLPTLRVRRSILQRRTIVARSAI